jgi:hypothetical protein
MMAELDALKRPQAETGAGLGARLPTLLNRAFKSQL